jgi:hypothetical protein
VNPRSNEPRWLQATSLREARRLYVELLSEFPERELKRLARAAKLRASSPIALWHYLGRYRWTESKGVSLSWATKLASGRSVKGVRS